MAKFTYIDLFAGIGGFHLALESIGGTCCGFSEIAPDAIKAYCTNYNITEEHNFGDITKLTSLPKHDFMTAGVPCQSWSIAGKNLGFDDDRGQLWNDTLFLLNESRPKTFIFENVKGLTDPRNKKALDYILDRIAQAGYYAQPFVLNAYDYGVPQTRVRIYIVGFKEKKYLDRLVIPSPAPGSVQLGDILDDYDLCDRNNSNTKSRWSLSCNEQGFNDYFLFNDLRNGHTTIHSWDIIPTTDRQKYICYMLLQNRRKSIYGILDGHAMALNHFRQIDPSIQLCEIEDLVAMGILKTCPYKYVITGDTSCLPEDDRFLLSLARCGTIIVDELKINKEIKKRKIKISQSLHRLEQNGIIKCAEIRYDFKNTKISTGLNGVNRIFLPTSKIYPTLVASDTNDYITTVPIKATTTEEWRATFMKEIYYKHKYRQITKSEACRIQGFPPDFILPTARSRWMKLIGNSVAVPVVKMLAQAIVSTGVFDENDWDRNTPTSTHQAMRLFDCI